MTPRLASLRARYDAVLLDVDGTLLDDRSRLTPRTRAAVGALLEAGFRVLLCTGRSMAGVRDLLARLGLETPAVTFNGGWIGRPGERPWRYAPLPDGLVPGILPAERRAAFAFRHRGEEKYTVAADHPVYERVAAWYRNVVRVATPARLPRRDLMRVTCYFADEAAERAAWEAIAPSVREGLDREAFPLRIFPGFENDDLRLCEIQARGRGKAEAFGYLAEEHGIPAARTIAVGDHLNDLPMLREAGLAVAVDNGVDPVARSAHLVVGHHADHGLARWVEAGAPRTAHDGVARPGGRA